MICKKCGYQNLQSAKYCSGCGKRLTESKRPRSYKGVIICLVAVACACMMALFLMGKPGKEYQITILSCDDYTIGLRADGTVVATSDSKYDFSDWSDISSIYSSYGHIVGLRSDGTVVAKGENEYGECDVSGWTDIVELLVPADWLCTFGLRSDGTVVATGAVEVLADEYDSSPWTGWTNVVKLYTDGYDRLLGLRKDGTVYAIGMTPSHGDDIWDNEGNVIGQVNCDVSDWQNIEELYVLGDVTIGLQKDGSLVTAGEHTFADLEEISTWKGIKEIVFDDWYQLNIAGLTTEGEVRVSASMGLDEKTVKSWKNVEKLITSGYTFYGLCSDGTVFQNVSHVEYYETVFYPWSDIVDICLGIGLVGLRADGTVVIGDSAEEKYEALDWTDIISIQFCDGHLVGLKKDGTLEVRSYAGDVNREVLDWNLLKAE